MANIDQTEATALLKATLNNTAYTTPGATIYLALDTVAPSSSSTFGTEVTGGSYARPAVAFSTASAGSTSNSGIVSFTSMPVATVVSVEIFNASTGTVRRLWYGNLTASKTTAAGDTLSFAVGAITATLG
jgi:hypothetical protein